MKALNKNILTMAIATVVTGVAVSFFGSSSIEANTGTENVDAKGYPKAPPSPFSIKTEVINVGVENTQENAGVDAAAPKPIAVKETVPTASTVEDAKSQAEISATTTDAATAPIMDAATDKPQLESDNTAVTPAATAGSTSVVASDAATGDQASSTVVNATVAPTDKAADDETVATTAVTSDSAKPQAKISTTDRIVADEAIATKMPTMPSAPNKPAAPVAPIQMESTSEGVSQQVQVVIEKLPMPEHAVVAFPHPDPAIDSVPDAPEATSNAVAAPSMPTPPAILETPKAIAAPVMPSAPTTQVTSAQSSPSSPSATEKPAALAMPKMPTMPQMPTLLMPVMAPNMQVQTHRPAMNAPAPMQMEMPPQLPLSMPQQMVAPQFSMPSMGMSTQQPEQVRSVAPPSQANGAK